MGRIERFHWLYVYRGCAKHGCKIGVTHERGLDGRLKACRARCPASEAFALTLALPNVFRIEQLLVSACDGRKIRPGREWFDMPVEELLLGVEFMRDFLSPERAPVRRYRMLAGHFLHAET